MVRIDPLGDETPDAFELPRRDQPSVDSYRVAGGDELRGERGGLGRACSRQWSDGIDLEPRVSGE
jgi:hypothetical protein